MTRSNLSGTNEFCAFVGKKCGIEFRDVLQEKERLEAAKIRDAILEGYQDLLNGRYVEFTGNLRETIKKIEQKRTSGWK